MRSNSELDGQLAAEKSVVWSVFVQTDARNIVQIYIYIYTG